jgi:hypothetical protein
MSDRLRSLTERELQSVLARLGTTLEFPGTPNLASDVRQALEPQVSPRSKGPARRRLTGSPGPWRRLAIAAVALGVAAVAIAFAGQAFLGGGVLPSAPSINGAIVFVRASSQTEMLPGETLVPKTSRLYRVNADGSGLALLTGGNEYDSGPVWSPDGSHLAFERHASNRGLQPTYGIYVMNRDGTGVRRLTECARSCSEAGPSWSPDGTRISFYHLEHGDRVQLRIVDADGTGPTSAFPVRFSSSGAPTWSPDGREMAFASEWGDGTKHGLVFMDVQSGKPRRMALPALEAIWNAAWSPDGSWIAFEAPNEELTHSDIYRVRPDGSDLQRVTACPGDGCRDRQPAWSPDGRLMVFARGGELGYGGDLMVVNADGTGLRVLTTGPDLDCCPSWQRRPESSSSPSPTPSPTPISVSIPDAVGECVLPDPVTPSKFPLTVTPRAECDASGTSFTPDGIPFGIFFHPERGFSFLSGRVGDPADRPIAGARVVLTVETLPDPLVAITDRLGQFAFLNIPVGKEGCTLGTIQVRAEGYGLFQETHQAFLGGKSYGQWVPVERRPVTYPGDDCSG